jgi:hypothetical protein
MKFLRYFTTVLTVLIFVLLVAGNLFYSGLRSLVEGNYGRTRLTDEETGSLNPAYNPDYSFILRTDKPSYGRFERVKLFARIVSRKTGDVPGTAVVTVDFSGPSGAYKNIDKSESIRLIYDNADKVWTGFWFPENDSVTGDIRASAKGYLDTPQASLSAESHFYIRESGPKFLIPKGQAFLGIDSLERISLRSLLAVDGREVDWNYIPDYVDYISSDGVLMMGGITKTFQEDITMDSPWEKDKLAESLTLADKLHQRGKKFGVWLDGFRVEGIYAKKVGYSNSLFLKDGMPAEDAAWISVADENRQKAVQKLFQSFMDNDSIAYAGIADIFQPDAYGLELIDRFVREFRIPLPGNWDNLAYADKFQYFWLKIKEMNLGDVFNSWKKVVAAEFLRDLIDKSGHKKPVFYYLEYETIADIPDLLPILFSSGVDFVVMNFNMPCDQIAQSLQKLADSPRASQWFDRVVVSYYLDYKNVDMTNYDLTAIENYAEANSALVRSGSDTLNASGIMINDLYKAMFGKRGPYTPQEWLLGIGESIYRHKEMNRVIPVQVETWVPESVHTGDTFTASFKIRNVSPDAVNNFRIDFIPLIGVKNDKNQPLQISTIPAGKEIFATMQLQLDTNNSQFVRKKNFVGMKVNWTEGSTGNTRNSGFILFEPVSIDKDVLSNTNVSVIR